MGGWLILSLAIALFVAGIAILIEPAQTRTWLAGLLPGLRAFIIAIFFIGIFGGLISLDSGKRKDGNYAGCKKIVINEPVISAVRDKTTSSSFILGTGGSHTIDRYFVYRDVEGRGLLFTTYYAKDTYIVEHDGTPRYERFDYKCPAPIRDFLWFSTDHATINKGKWARLYVPHDTILREFKM